jgi:Glycosyl hydrolase family 26/Purple acid Phosphatase, N-terminal domain
MGSAPIYWGISQTAGITAAQIDAFEASAGKKMSLLGIGGTWWGGGVYPTGAYQAFPTSKAALIHGRGGILIWDWIPGNGSSGAANDVGFNLPSIYNGNHDAYITAQANTIKGLGYPVWIRPFHEMNGSWYTWYYQANTAIGNGGFNSGEVILAWKRIVDLFEAAGCDRTHVQWIFNPNVMSTTTSSTTHEPLIDFYPGDAYVDWYGIDGYNDDAPWKTLQQVCEGGAGLQNTLANLMALSSTPKPVLIPETGCQDTRGGVVDGASKAQWFIDAFETYLPQQPLIQGIVYSNYVEAPHNWQVDYPLTGSGSGTTWPAFAHGIQNPHFLQGGAFALSANDIKPYWLDAPNTDRFRIAVDSAQPQGYWRAQETSGTTLADDSGNANTATLVGTPTLNTIASVVPSNPGNVSVQFANADVASGFTLADNDRWSPAANSGEALLVVPFILDALPTSTGFLMAKGDTNQFEWEISIGGTGIAALTLRQLLNDASTAFSATTACPLGQPLLAMAMVNTVANVVRFVLSSRDGHAFGDLGNISGGWTHTLGNGTSAVYLGKRTRSLDHCIPGKIAHWAYIGRATASIDPLIDIYNAWAAAPAIVGAAASVGSITPTTAVVTWTTDIPATTQVSSGLSGAYGTNSPIADWSTLATSHSVALANLSPNTTYHFSARSRNRGGVEAATTDATFTTSPVAVVGTGGFGHGPFGHGAFGHTTVDVYDTAEAAISPLVLELRLDDVGKGTLATALDTSNSVPTMPGVYNGLTAVDGPALPGSPYSVSWLTDGTDYVRVADDSRLSPQIGGAIWLSFWFQLNALPTVNVTFVCKHAGGQAEYTVDYSAAQQWRWYMLTAAGAIAIGPTFTRAVTLGTWHRFDGIFESTLADGAPNKSVMYLDGLAVASATTIGANVLTNGTAGVYVGRRGDGSNTLGTVASPAVVKDVRLRGFAPSAQQVLSLYYSGMALRSASKLLVAD